MSDSSSAVARAAEPSNVADFAQYVPLLGSVEDDVVRCFREGGGVPYARYARFHEVMAEDSGQTVLPALKDHILPLVPRLTQRLDAGIRVLDVGYGRGRALNLMAGWFPGSCFVGFDLSKEAIAFARQEAERQGHGNVTFVSRDLSRFDQEAERAAFDLVATFDAIQIRRFHVRCCAASACRSRRMASISRRTSRARATCTSTASTPSAPFCTRYRACTA
jgi:SAM-dependent methyltransferase